MTFHPEYSDKFYHDSIHGSIGVSKAEDNIIRSKTFQRLRSIKHLGLTSLVFPSAEHTRLAHSLGVLHIMGRMAYRLQQKGFFNQDDVKKLRMAALLHDIGHYPLSHLVESVYRMKGPASKLFQERKSHTNSNQSHLSRIANSKTKSREAHHERLGALVITTRDEIKEILVKYNFDPEEIARIINGEHKENPKYDQLMHSDLDADRIDYLMRDATFTGVTYGQIDLDYLLNHLDVDVKNNIVGIKGKGRHAAEHFLISRFFMYSIIVYHKSVLSFETLAKACYEKMMDDKIVYKDFEAVKGIVNKDDFLQFNDNYFYSNLRSWIKPKDEDDLYKKCYEALLQRKSLPVLVDEKAMGVKGHNLSEAMSKLQTRIPDKLKPLLKKHGVPFENSLFYEIDKMVVDRRATYNIKESGLTQVEKNELLYIIDERKAPEPLIADESSIIHHLGTHELTIQRLHLLDVNPEDITFKELQTEINSWRK